MLMWDQTPGLRPMRGCRAWVDIDLAALRHNVAQLRHRLGPGTALMAVVKADAYGHGAATVARCSLEAGASWLGVATVPEGIELRQAAIHAPILVMGAINDEAEIRAAAQWRLQPALVSPKQGLIMSDVLGGANGAAQLPVHLQIDTGMGRLGFPWERAVELVQFARRLPRLSIASLYSHLATADSPDLTTMLQQHQRFRQAVKALQQHHLCPPCLHFANSAATLVGPELHYDMVRVGLALYGLYPAPHLQSAINLRPVLQVRARITHLKAVPEGTGISYGHRHVTSAPARIAVVGIGYADGVPRSLSNQMEVLVRGQRVRQVGAITMDQLMVDVTGVPDLQEGDVVTLLGQDGSQQITADDWATHTGTISWEILCGFKHRLPRITSDRPLPQPQPRQIPS